MGFGSSQGGSLGSAIATEMLEETIRTRRSAEDQRDANALMLIELRKMTFHMTNAMGVEPGGEEMT